MNDDNCEYYFQIYRGLPESTIREKLARESGSYSGKARECAERYLRQLELERSGREERMALAAESSSAAASRAASAAERANRRALWANIIAAIALIIAIASAIRPH